jgi:hypothetical protein
MGTHSLVSQQQAFLQSDTFVSFPLERLLALKRKCRFRLSHGSVIATLGSLFNSHNAVHIPETKISLAHELLARLAVSVVDVDMVETNALVPLRT